MLARTLAVVGLVLLPLNGFADTFGSGENAFEIEFVTIGNPGNPPDTTGSPNPAGSVDYVYRIGKYEVSRAMVERANLDGDLEVTTYSENRYPPAVQDEAPAKGLSWNKAARFVNFLNTSKGYFPAYKFHVQPGATGYDSNASIELWQNGDSGYNSANPFRNRRARYFLPSVDEWYKAAYFDPGLNVYFDYPTGSDTEPISVLGGTTAGTAVYDVKAFCDWEGCSAWIKSAGGLSPYGTMAQGGNVFEWEETELDLSNNDPFADRAVRGGHWQLSGDYLMSSVRGSASPFSDGGGFIGFRVASTFDPCDFNNDGVLDADDINELTSSIAAGSTDLKYDMDGSGVVNGGDIIAWAHDCFGTWIGDANLDHRFTSDDLIEVAAARTYERDVEAVWTTGDWTGDGRFTSKDLISAAATACYEAPCGPYWECEVVPEPGGGMLCVLGLAVAAGRRKSPARR